VAPASAMGPLLGWSRSRWGSEKIADRSSSTASPQRFAAVFHGLRDPKTIGGAKRRGTEMELAESLAPMEAINTK